MPLPSANGATLEVVEFSGKSSPTVENGKLQWTPAGGDVGRQTMKLRASLGKFKHEWVWPFYVSFRPIEAPFDVTGMAMEPIKRQRAVVWGVSRDVAEGKEKAAEHYYIGIIDFPKRKLLVHRELKQQVYTAAMSTRNLFVAPTTGSQGQHYDMAAPTEIVRLALPSLEIEDQIVFNFPQQSRMYTIADKYLQIGVTGPVRFTIPDLKPVPPVMLRRDLTFTKRTGAAGFTIRCFTTTSLRNRF